MTRKLPRYTQGWVDREGRAHHYFRRTGYPRAPLPGLPWSVEFMAAYSTAIAAAPLAIGAAKRSKPGSVPAAIAGYFDSSSHFGCRAPGTQQMQRTILQRFREQYGEYPIAQMPSKFIAAILAKKKPYAARNWLKTLRALCRFAIEQGWLRDDPTASAAWSGHKTLGEIKRYTDAADRARMARDGMENAARTQGKRQ
jgi:hypothetical protein